MSDWTTKTWQVESSDTSVGLLTGDQLSFLEPGGDGIRVQNRSFVWGTGCVYVDDSQATVTYAGDIYKLERFGTRLTCTLTTPSLLGSDHPWPSHAARRKVQAKSMSEREFPTLDPPPSSWTAIEGGGGG